jgi:GDP-D-mannose 3', 5'-epimerase
MLKIKKTTKKALVTGAGGFIGHHLTSYLKKKGYWVRGVDIKKPEYSKTDADEFIVLNLKYRKNGIIASEGVDEVYALAADMGGMGYISKYHSRILHTNLLINLHTLDGAVQNKVKRYFFASSACIYPEYKQSKTNVSLKESDAYPAYPQDAYGWEKLVTEILTHHYSNDHKIQTRVARFHNIYGPEGTWDGERAKAPSALCRKIAIAKLTNKKEIDIWGDGKQTRSFCYIDDCLKGIYKLAHSTYKEPVNIGSEELVTINHLADIIADIAGVKIKKVHIIGPQGVRGRNSDNTLVRATLKWEPSTSLYEGLSKTYKWVEGQVKATM